MKAIFKREFNAYFDSPLGYVFVAVYALLAGYFFFRYNLYASTTDMRELFTMLFTVTIFLIPILTMRLMSEDKKAKTDQLLLMTPVTTLEIILGKFFAALTVYVIAMSVTLLQALVLSRFSTPDWPVILGHFLGLFLVGASLIGVGIFISALTESQIIAAVGGFCVGFFLVLLDSLGTLVEQASLGRFLVDFSYETRYRSFTLGLFDLSDIVFFVSITALFLYCTILAFERRRLS